MADIKHSQTKNDLQRMKNFLDEATKQELVKYFSHEYIVDSQEYMTKEREWLERHPDLNTSKLAWLYQYRGEEKRAVNCMEKIENDDFRFEQLAYLFFHRRKKRKANAYIDKISDPERQLLVSMTLYECRG